MDLSALLHDTNMWVAVSFVIFCVLAYVYGRSAILNVLDSKIDSIRKEVEHAESLRVEAQELLAQYQRKTKNARQEAEDIIQRAQANAEKLKQETAAKLDVEMQRREAQLAKRIALMEEKAREDIKNHATNLTLRATSEIIAKAMNKTENARLSEEVTSVLSSKSLH